MSQSLESAMEEERREIMRLLEEPRGTQPRPPTNSIKAAMSGGSRGRSASPIGARSPVRSMLDIGVNPQSVRHSSIAGLGVGVSTPSARIALEGTQIRSMLGPTASPTSSRISHSANTPPTEIRNQGIGLHRAQSDASGRLQDVSLRHLSDRERTLADRSRFGPNAEYQFDMLPSVQSQAMPKRVTQGGKKASSIPNSMASVVHSADIGRSSGGSSGGARWKHNSTAGIGRSKSPSSGPDRSQSPVTRTLSTNCFNLVPITGPFVNDTGSVIDMNSAYRRLTDVALARSGGTLSTLSPSQHVRAGSGEVLSPSGGVRLQKDYYKSGELEKAVESSDEESTSGDGGLRGVENKRGRRKSGRRGTGSTGDDNSDDGSVNDGKKTLGMGRAGGQRTENSLKATAEEESHQIAAKNNVKSLLEPTMLVAGPGGERLPVKKQGVHPSASFDSPASGVNTPHDSDNEEMKEIRKAQNMSVVSSIIHSTPESHRAVRTIHRGDFSKMEEEAKEGIRRQRTYVVATDLSDEAAHALEWTIGTVLRDGDTLYAIYAVDQETGTGKGGDSEGGVRTGEGASTMMDTAAVVNSLTRNIQNTTSSALSPLAVPGLGSGTIDTAGNSPNTRNMSKREQERYHATEDISQRIVRLLRKTRLQVRVVVEVIHCKSPQRLITEVIDFIEPVLVILGSRGRSALKGVLLGSFSNYLVTKSSSPVMVARQRLKKGKYSKAKVRLSNNLINPSGKSLAEAKIG
ncbi:MAG: hypothetical protein M1827_005580 [Pycnora praestabilis]|nr:MAG: hypothetical protein M1827_005580 [Pycnora praestabilis]